MLATGLGTGCDPKKTTTWLLRSGILCRAMQCFVSFFPFCFSQPPSLIANNSSTSANKNCPVVEEIQCDNFAIDARTALA